MANTTKIPLVKMNQDDADAILPLGDYRDARNLAPSNSGVSANVTKENVKGISDISMAMPVGTNKCIGTFSDEENSKLIYFNYNSNGTHAIYSINPETNAVSTLISGSVLNFKEDALITGIGVTNNLLYWSDGVNPQRVINMSRSYSSYTSQDISLLKHAPMKPIKLWNGGRGRRTDSTRTVNLITDKNLQFAYRYVFLDNERSSLSPYSQISVGDVSPDSTRIADNYVDINVFEDQDLDKSIKSYEILVRESNDADWKVFHRRGPLPMGYSNIILKYYGDESLTNISDDEESKAFDAVPSLSNSLTIFENRTFLVADQEGYDNEDSYSLSLSASYIAGEQYKSYGKEGGQYNVGVIFYDDYGRFNGVTAVESITFDRSFSETTSSISSTKRPSLNVSISGTPPVWAKKYQLVRTKERRFSSYAHLQTMICFFARNLKEDETIEYPEAYWSSDGFLFRKLGVSSGANPAEDVISNWTGRIYLKMPVSLPFVPDNTYKVRVVTDINDGKELVTNVLDVQADYLVVDNFGVADWFSMLKVEGSGATFVSKFMNIEVYKENSTKTEDIFYPFSDVYDVDNPGELTRSFSKTSFSHSDYPLGMDTFYIDYRVASPTSTTQPAMRISLAEAKATSYIVLQQGNSFRPSIESPSPMLIDKFVGSQSNAAIPGTETGEVIETITKSTVPDYDKISSSLGKPTVEIRDERQFTRNTTIRFSNTFVQDGAINGLSSFDSLNQYTLPSSRTPIKKLQPAGNVLIAIHERDCSSLYINENIIVSSDGSDQLTKSDDVIGTDRPLRGGYGTLHPESVVEHEGKVYWFDASKGEVVRYDLNGLVPIGSTYKMKSYFKKKGDIYATSGGSVVGGYDPYRKIYFLTFTDDNETIGFLDKDGEEGWISYYDFSPEFYGKINNKMYSFVSGKVYEHNSNDTYNNFYGVQYDSEIKVLHNEHYSKEKVYRSIAVESNDAWEMTSATNPEGQDTDLLKSDFTQHDKVYYADFMRDKNSVVTAGESALMSGDEMRSKVLEITLKNDSTEKVNLDYIDVSYIPSPGHRNV